MRVVAVGLGLVTVAALNLILLVGAGGELPARFGLLVLVMDLSLLGSSLGLGVLCLANGRRLLGALFLGNLLVMAGALALRAADVPIPRAVLFGADLYWLNLYLVGLVICTRGRPASPSPAVLRGAAR